MAASPSGLLLTWILILTIPRLYPASAEALGVNWGRAASHPLPAETAVQLLKANGVTKVKLFEADPEALGSLSGSNIDVTVGIPDSTLRSLNSSLKAAQSWVRHNITRYFAEGKGLGMEKSYRYVLVGDEPFLDTYGAEFYPFLVGAATNIQTALAKANFAKEIKVAIPCSFDAIQSESGMPPRGNFRTNINKTMVQVLKFLSHHQSPLFVTISPFQDYLQNKNVSLDAALFKENVGPSHGAHKSSFEFIYETLNSALSSAGFPELDIIIGGIGWPTDGAANATPSNAEVFLKGLVEHLKGRSGNSLLSKELPLQTYIMSLLDEDKRGVASGTFERHWGVFTFDGQAKYHVDFGHASRKMVNAQNVHYLPSKWCVVNNYNKDLSNANAQASYACSASDCSALSRGGSCSDIGGPGKISYAFNSYYQQNSQNADGCNFGGLGLITTVDPSVGTCRFFVQLSTSVSVSLHTQDLLHWLVSPLVPILLLLLGGVD